MAKLKAPFALDRSLNTTEQASRNIADVLAEELSAIITALGGLNFINYEVVEELPTTGISTTTIYLVPSDDPQSGNTYDEYINLNGTSAGWEKIGSTAIDLSGYYTSAETDALLDEKVDKDSFDEQTATDEFTTINGGLLSECKVTLSPNQDLHGYLEPWVGGAGKNKVFLTLNNLKAINTNGTWSGNDYTYRGVTYSVLTDDADNVLGIKANGQATQNSLFVLWVVPIFTGTCILSGCPANGSVNTYHLQYSNYVNYTYEQIGTDVSVTQFDAETYPNARMQIIVNANYTANDLIFTPMLRASGESADFAPYSNICPITGHTQVDVDVSDGQTTQEQVTVNLDDTYYSGILDVVSGVFVPDTAFDTLSADNFNGETGTSGGGLHYYDWNNGLSKKSGICLCSMMPQNNSLAWQSTTPCIQMSSGGGHIRCYVEEATKEAFKTAYSGMQICYELDNPTPIQLSPQQVQALVGENHLSAPLDGQEITESKYKKMFTFDDVIAYIQSLS